MATAVPISVRNGWGNIQAQLASIDVAGASPNQTWTARPNVGVGINVTVANRPVRLTYIHARAIILTPGMGAVLDGTSYRLMVLRGSLPPDISAFQNNIIAPPTGKLEVPALIQGMPLDVLDDWTYQSRNYAPSGVTLPDGSNSISTNQIAGARSTYLDGKRFEVHHEFGASGAVVYPNDQLNVIWVPMITGSVVAAAPAVTNGPYQIYYSLSAWGEEIAAPVDGMTLRALPRFDFDSSRHHVGE